MISEFRQCSSGNRKKLENYIRRSLKKELSPAEIKLILAKAGWAQRLINSVLDKEIRGKKKGKKFHRYFGITLIIMLTLSLAGLLAFSNLSFTGAFIANGIDWENKIDLPVNTSQQIVSFHVVFGDNKPDKCTDYIYVEALDRKIDFKTENEIYIDGKCFETNIIFDNLIYNPSENQTNITTPKIPITAFAISEGIETITYTIYYGRIIPEEDVIKPEIPIGIPEANITEPIANEIIPENTTNITPEIPQITGQKIQISAFNVKDKYGNKITADVKLLSENLQILTAEEIEPGAYNLEIDIQNHIINKITVSDAQITGITGNLFLLDELPAQNSGVRAYAINPMINFSSAEISLVAKGNALFKCKDWNFEARTCEGDWQSLMALSPGQPYTFMLSPEDPGYMEITQQLPYYAFNNSGTDVRAKVNVSDNIRANLTVAAGEDDYFILNFTGAPLDSVVNNITAFFEHNEDTTSNFNVSLWLYNRTSGNWMAVCDIQERLSEYIDSCTITNYVESPSTGNISLKYDVSNTGGADQIASLDFTYLYINYTPSGYIDLIPTSIDTTPYGPDLGDGVITTVTILNNETNSTITGFNTTFFIDNVATCTNTLDVLTSQNSTNTSCEWIIGSGIHTIKIAIDLENIISEFNETNNNMTDGVGSAWSGFQQGEQRRGVSHVYGPSPTSAVKCTFLAGTEFSAASFNGQNFYAVAPSAGPGGVAELFAFDTNCIEICHAYLTMSIGTTVPAISSNGYIYLTSGDLQAYDSSDCTNIFKNQGTNLTSAPTVVNDIVYATGVNNAGRAILDARNANTGVLIWKNTWATTSVASAPSYDDGVVYVGVNSSVAASNTGIWAFDAATGSSAAVPLYTTVEPIEGTIAIGRDKLYALTIGSTVKAYAVYKNGTLAWSQTLPSCILSNATSPTFDGSYVYVACADNPPGDDNNFYKLDANTGDISKQFNPGPNIIPGESCSLSSRSNIIYCPANNSLEEVVYGLTTSDLTLLGTSSTGSLRAPTPMSSGLGFVPSAVYGSGYNVLLTADLAPLRSIYSPVGLIGGENVTVNFTIININHTVNAGAFKVSFLLDSTLIENRTVAGLIAGETKTLNFNTIVTGDGLHDLKLIIDADNDVGESDETNNVAIQPIAVNWAAYTQGPDHRAFLNVSIAPVSNRTKWIYSTSGVIRSSPTIANDIVYVGSDDYSFYAVNLTNGTLIWSYDTGVYARTAAAYYQDKVYFGAGGSFDTNKIYVLNATTGGEICTYTVSGGPFSASPIVSNDVIYVGDGGGGNFYAIDATDCSYIWSYHNGGYGANSWTYSSASLGNNLVYMSNVNDGYKARKISDGSLVNTYGGSGVVRSAPLDDDIIYIANKVYNKTNGSQLWSSALQYGMEYNAPALAYNKIFLGEQMSAGSAPPYPLFYAFNATNGTEIWNFTTTSGSSGSIYSSPAIAAGKVYFENNDTIYVLNESTGALIWKKSVASREGAPSSPALAYFEGSTYLIASENDSISAFEIAYPSVTALSPANGTNIGAGSVEIAANVTDDFEVSAVLANVTAPDGTSEIITLTNISIRYSKTYALGQTGWYFVRIIANDTDNLLNNTETTMFNATGNYISNCFNITTPNQNYILTQDLVGNLSDGTCLHAGASNIIVDCANHHINGTYAPNPGYGSYTAGIYFGNDVQNVIVKNCYVHNYSHGVYFSYAGNSTLSSSHIYGNYHGIRTQTTNYSRINNNTIFNNIYNGIYVIGSGGEDLAIGHNNITNNRIFNNSNHGIYLDGDNERLLLNNTLYSNGGYDFYSTEDIGNISNINNTFGIINPTTVSFTFATGVSINVNEVENPPVDTADYLNISKYLNMSSNGGVVNLNISYSEAELGIYNENSLIEQKYYTAWVLMPSTVNAEKDYISSSVNPVLQIIYAPFINKNDYYSVYSCMNITMPGRYVLRNNILNDPALVCINITASNVSFDGSNFTIDGIDKSKSKGILTDTTTNVTIENVTVTDWVSGVYLLNSQNGSITNTNVSNSYNGIYISGSSIINITSSELFNQDSDNSYITSSSDLRFVSNNFSSNPSGLGVNIDSSNNILFESNVFNDNYGGFYSYGCSNLTLISNTLDSNDVYGIYLDTTYYSNVTANMFNNNTVEGMYISACDNSTFTSNTAENNPTYDIYLYTSPNAVFRNQTITGQTSIDFVWYGEIWINGTTNSLADPGSYLNISKYVQSENVSAGSSLALNISYSAADLGSVDESTLVMARNNGSWETTTSVFASTYGVNTAANYVYANITGFGSIFAPLGTSGGFAECNFTALIDGSEIFAFASAGRPYNVTVNASELAGTPLDNATVKTIEYNGYSLFAMPQFQQTNISEKVWGESWTDANGRVSYAVVPTGARYVSESDVGSYNITIEIYREGESTVCASKNFTVTDKEFPDATGTVTIPNTANIDSYKTEVLRVYDRVKSWLELGGGQIINMTIYTNGTIENIFSVVAGKPYGINVTVKDPGGEPVSGAVVQFTEKNGYPPFILPQSGISNATNYNRGLAVTGADGNARITIVPTGGRYVSESTLGNYTIELSVYNSTATFNTTNIQISDKEFPDASGSAETIYNQNNIDSFKTEVLRIYDRIKSWLGG